MDGIGPVYTDHDGESVGTHSEAGTDGLLNHENEELRDRVSSLEKKVQQHEDEILCLKSALSDALRRLSAVESGKAFHNSVLPSKPSFKGTPPSATRRSLPASPSPSPMRRDYGHRMSTSPTPNRVVPRGPVSPGGSVNSNSSGMRKWPSVPSHDTANGHLSPASEFRWNGSSSPFNGHHREYERSRGSRRSGSLSSLTLTGKTSPFPARGAKDPAYNQAAESNEPRRRSSSFSSSDNNKTVLGKIASGAQHGEKVKMDDGQLRIFLRGRAVSLFAPSNLGDYDVSKLGQAPQETLKLEWVYGYRGRDARSNLFLLPTGEIVYFIAATVVLYNVEEQMQRHYLGHTDDVKCMALHPDKITMATGQVAGHDKKEGKHGSPRKKDRSLQPHIRIWDSVSLHTLHVIGLGEFERAVACVAFSKADGGSLLVAVDEANEHLISVWEWDKGEKGHKITETKSSTEPVLAAEFHPCDKNMVVTCGKSHLGFWTLEGGTLSKKLGIYEKHEKPKFVTCMVFAENGDLITGDSNGSIFVWGRGQNKISKALVGVHEGGIFSLCVMKDGNVLSGGGKDRRIIQWSNAYQKTGQETEIPEQFGGVRMLSQGKGNMILVGTTRNQILQGTIDLEFSPIIQGHVEELWGLATHPNQNQFVTCGYDRNLYLWDTLTHSAIWCKELPDGAHCACFHPDGTVLVVGTQSARWLVIDVTTHDVIYTHTDGNEQLECMEISPDGKMLAIGSRDNYIYVYNISEDGKKYSRHGRCSGHSSFVTHLDWTTDGKYLQSNSGDYEVLYWSSSNCKQVTSPSSLRDVEWATHNCTLGFNVCGIWPEGADGTDVNACGRSHKQHLVASADDFGKVNLFSYPCCQPKSTGHVYGGHSSHVTSAKFLYDDNRLLTTGGKDMAILQWEVI